MNEVVSIIDQNNLNQIDYDVDNLERVRDECGDYLKSLELNVIDIAELASPQIDMSQGLGEATSNVNVRQLGPVNSKSTLDKAAEKSTRMARLRSSSRTKDPPDSRAPWDPHHT